RTMSDLDQQFEQAQLDAKALSERPDNDVLLDLYALYKQATEGDVAGDKPGFFDFVAVAKYEAWERLEGTEPEAAKQKYIDLVNRLKG
ncbi:MAG: acyl-CoA-binding protein, partial [Xanthomonadales bacterium]|nr:acyl-CoA-binding protein [Xanthomonadales bacterium]